MHTLKSGPKNLHKTSAWMHPENLMAMIEVKITEPAQGRNRKKNIK